MLNNQALIRERLGALGLAPQREDEILRELGDHVEDSAAALEEDGVSPEEALREALDSVPCWHELSEEIRRVETEEVTMNYRTKVLWLPALIATAISSGLLALFQSAGLVPRFYWLTQGSGSHLFFVFYFPWLCLLPLVGALAAFLSKHAGSRVIHRLLAALAPALGTLAAFLAIPFITLGIYTVMSLLHRRPAYGGFYPVLFLTAFLIYFLNWVLVPAIALLIGAAPFLRKANPAS